jgi:hypothetical protein
MAGEGAPSTALPLAAKKVVDADLRRHDKESSATGQATELPG